MYINHTEIPVIYRVSPSNRRTVRVPQQVHSPAHPFPFVNGCLDNSYITIEVLFSFVLRVLVGVVCWDGEIEIDLVSGFENLVDHNQIVTV